MTHVGDLRPIPLPRSGTGRLPDEGHALPMGRNGKSLRPRTLGVRADAGALIPSGGPWGTSLPDERSTLPALAIGD